MEVVIIIFLIVLNGFFVMSELALVSARKFKLENSIKKGNSNAKDALNLSNNPNIFFSAVQIGITLITILIGTFGEGPLTENVEKLIASVPILSAYAIQISHIVIILIITFITIVFGELIPKKLGLMYPEKIAILVAKPIIFISFITKPFVFLITVVSDFFFKIFRLKASKDSSVSEEEIKAMISESTESGEIEEIEQSIVNRVFALGDRKVSELMTHRNDIVWFDVDDTLETIKEKANEEIHSVYPVCEKELDKIIGVISIKDIFPIDFKKKKFVLNDYLKQPIFVPETTMAYQLMEKFKQNKFHYAVVIDEYGSLEGMLTMDDVLDALIGDMSEYNQDEYQIIERDDHTWLIDGQYPFYEFLHYFDLDEEEHNDGNYNTIGGFIMNELNKIPETGEKLHWNNFTFEIVDMDGNRIDKILITVIENE